MHSHDEAVRVGDFYAIKKELERYDPLAYLLCPGQDYNHIRRRYEEQVDGVLELVRLVNEGHALPPLMQP